MKLKGRIVSGIGTGSHFVSLDGYTRQFKEKLGIEPFEGTLNIELDKKSVDKYRDFIESENRIKLEAFEKGGEEYGEVKVFHAKLKDAPCFLVVPEKGIYRGIVEVVSEHRLRDKLGLKDGDEVVLKVFQNSSST